MADITEYFTEQLRDVEPGTPVMVFFGLSYKVSGKERALVTTRKAVLAGQPITNNNWNIMVTEGVYATGDNTSFSEYQNSIPMFEVK